MQDKEFFDDLKQVLKTAKKGFTNATTGGALHTRLKTTKPSTIDTVKKLVESIPEALSFKHEEDLLPQFNQRLGTALLLLSNVFLFLQTKE